MLAPRHWCACSCPLWLVMYISLCISILTARQGVQALNLDRHAWDDVKADSEEIAFVSCFAAVDVA